MKVIKFGKGKLKEEKEMTLLKQLVRFPEIIGQAAETRSPNLICNYVFELARDFNSFYEAVPVLKTEDNNLIMTRLALVEATAQVIKNGLSLLGIKVLEKM